MVLTHLLSNHH